MLRNKACENKTDEELINLILENNDYYICLMLRYENRIKNYIYRISGLNQQDIEDLTQDIFIKIYRNLNDFDNSYKFTSWLYRIAHNETISYLRKQKIRPKVFGGEDEILIFEKISTDENIEADFEKKEIIFEVKKVLEKLQEKYKSVLVLKYLEERNYRKI